MKPLFWAFVAFALCYINGDVALFGKVLLLAVAISAGLIAARIGVLAYNRAFTRT